MKHLLFLLFLLCANTTFAQSEKVPVLKSNTFLLDIKEGGFLYEKTWTMVNDGSIDVFVTNPFDGTKQVTFYSDIDSLSFTVKPNQKYNFIILLNGNEQVSTQISTFTNEKPSLPLKTNDKK
jgi:hypothetical protein